MPATLRVFFVAILALLIQQTPVPADPVPADASGNGRIRFGIFTPIQNTTYEDLATTWKEAEALGFDSAWVNDHIVTTPPDDEDDPQLEGWTALAALATQTKKLRIGVLVTGNTYRNPALLAKMATTVDHISNGRLLFGIGAGWFEREHEAYGFHFGTAKERAQRLEEALQVINRLWGEDHPDFDGKHYSLRAAPYAPSGVQQPRIPIVIGGQGKKWIVPLVSRYADAWNAPMTVTPEGVRERREIIARECDRIGRDACPTDVSVQLVLLSINRIPLSGPFTRFVARALVGKQVARSLLADSPGGTAKRLREYINAGADEFILTLRSPYDRDLMRTFAEEVIPRVNAKGRSSRETKASLPQRHGDTENRPINANR
jgi:F420-dependent oxidoreductase-like protein